MHGRLRMSLSRGCSNAGGCRKVARAGPHSFQWGRSSNPRAQNVEVESGNGLKLIGVEYWFSIGPPDTPIPDPAPAPPVIFGRPLEGPMEAHEPGQPPHYDLHAWVWQGNPSGVFAQFNPNVNCD